MATLATLCASDLAAQRVPDVRVDTDTPGAGNSRESHIAADGDSIYLVWIDDRNGNDDVYFNRSEDRGSTWLANDVRLDTDVAGASTSATPRIAAANGNVYVIWSDARNGARDVYANWSNDQGATWQPTDRRLSTNAAGSSNATEPCLRATGTNVYVAWEDNRNGNRDIYANLSNDSGTTWRATDLRLDSNTTSSFDSRKPQIAADGNSVYVVWHDARNGGS
ncbi:MAG: hypothetical protein KDB80_02235, partial [Planctomycetes bacterium]|nr:hypothetical protein [Planctomycetota bacterium]